MTWAVADGRDDARPLACFFAIERALERAAQPFAREFGVAPRLRAALHGGPVISGEVGGSRRAIVFHGDVMNTRHASNTRHESSAASSYRLRGPLDRLVALEGFALEDLGLPARRYTLTCRQTSLLRSS